MQKNHPIHLTAEEMVFVSRIEDMATQVERRGIPRYSHFLDLRQQELAQYAVNRIGGCEREFIKPNAGGERCILKLYTQDYYGEDHLPVTLLRIGYTAKAKLTHRDFLGAILQTGIKRETIGDILIGAASAYIWVLSSIENVLLQELVTVGRYAVTVEITEDVPTLPQQSFLEIDGTVSSLRLDCIVSHLLNVSRETGVKLIKSGHISVNGQEILEVSKTISPVAIISIRRYGRYRFDAVGDTNKKGRIRIYCKKYC